MPGDQDLASSLGLRKTSEVKGSPLRDRGRVNPKNVEVDEVGIMVAFVNLRREVMSESSEFPELLQLVISWMLKKA